MRTLAVASLLALALSACAQTGSGLFEQARSNPSATQTASTEAGALYAGLPGVTPALADWSNTGFYPNEFCWKIYVWPRTAPNYWDIRRYCERPERGSSLWEPE